MRPAILALALGGVLLSSSACTGPSATPQPAGSTSPASASTSLGSAPASPAAAPASIAADYTANTKVVCARLKKVFTADLAAFGTDLGKMLAYQDAKDRPQTLAAQKTARATLRASAAKVRQAATAAQDPDLRTAGVESATKLSQSANDPNYFVGVKTAKDMDRKLNSEVALWVTPIAGYCP